MLLNNFIEGELKTEWGKGENDCERGGRKGTQVRGPCINSG